MASRQECCCRKTSLQITIIVRLTVPPLCSVKILPKWVCKFIILFPLTRQVSLIFTFTTTYVPVFCSSFKVLSYPASVLLATHQTLAGWQGGSTLKSLDMMRIIWDFIVSQKCCALWLQVLNGHNDCLSLIWQAKGLFSLLVLCTVYAYLIFHHRANLYLFNIFLFCFNVELTVGIFLSGHSGCHMTRNVVTVIQQYVKKESAKNKTHTKNPKRTQIRSM